MVGYEHYLADGALGLGYISKNRDDKGYVEGSNFIEKFVNIL